jgi:magnesium chelatase accessory protein
MSSRPDWAVDGRDWPNRDHSRFVEAGGVRWHVQVAGKGPVLLLLHGTGAATHSWRDVLPLLADKFTVIAPDLPGHGFTAAGPKTLPTMAGAIAKLLGALDVEPQLIVGHSAGAAVGIQMILAGAVNPRALVALNPALLPFPGLAAKLFPTMAKLLFVNPFMPHIISGIAQGAGEVDRFMARSTGSKLDAAGVEFYRRLFVKPAHIAGTMGMMASWDLELLKRALPTLAVPTLVIHGSADTAIPLAKAREATGLIPAARFESLEGLGHLAHEEVPARIADMIMAFATEHAG